MSQLFLLNEAIDLKDFDSFKEGMSELIAINREKGHVFRKHESVYFLEICQRLYKPGGYLEQEILKFINQLPPCEDYVDNEQKADYFCENDFNAFLGIEFFGTSISPPKRIIDNVSYEKFTTDYLWKVTFRNFWARRNQLFPNLILCGEVQNQISKIGNSSQFNQIIDRLKEFNNAVKNWKSGNFNYGEINQKFALKISPESSNTMSKYKNERIFSLPTGGTAIFELHIKTGDLRFHFYPDNANRKVYIGYIGSHLTI